MVGDASWGSGGGDELSHRVVGFLSAPKDVDAAARLPSVAYVGAETDWWSMLGGDSVSATELISLWEQASRGEARSLSQPLARPHRF